MKIERISSTQVRCTLTSFDLSVRNLNLGELTYGSEKAKSLFQEMLQKAHSECGFETEDMPVMIEATPLSDESIMLIITKLEDPDELDTRFAKFTPIPENDILPPGPAAFASSFLEGAEAVNSNLPKKEDSVRVFEFSDIDIAAQAAARVKDSNAGNSLLYKNAADKKYYLLVECGENNMDFAATCNILSEYGRMIPHNYSSKAYYDEHCELLISHDAINGLSRI